MISGKIINVSKLTLYRGLNVIIDSLDLNLDRGAALIIRGENGSGKTTLLRALAGLLPPHEGQTTINGYRLDEDRIGAMQSLIFIGHRDGFSGHLTATENLSIWAQSRGEDNASVRAAIPQALDALGIAALSGTPLYLMSEGQRKRCGLSRLSLALAINAKSPLWLLDEPLTALDQTMTTTLAGLIEQHAASGGVTILSTHHDIQLRSADILELGALS